MTDPSRQPRRTVSPERQGIYTVGMVLQVLAGVGFLVCFLGFASDGWQVVTTFGNKGDPMQWWVGAVASMVGMIVGGAMRNLAARGVAGSGLVLDPERAREDLEPWARTGGALLRDAVDEAGLGQARSQSVKVRCAKCRTLNDEDAKFCDNCGTAM